MNIKIYCPDIECDSCVRSIEKSLHNKEGVENISVNHDSVDILYDHQKISSDTLIQAIKDKGYRAGLEPFSRKTFTERCRDFWQNKKKYEVEYAMLKHGILTFALLCAIEIAAYVAWFSPLPDFLERYGWWIFYTNIAVVSIGSAIWHIKSYRANVTSMVGMMIGMTFGMQTGMMLGTIVAMTNGLFIGGLVGMLIAVMVGFYNGKCCGIMGVLEGVMAGTMGGIMGSMIGTMFRVEHILWLMPAFFVVNVLVMFGLSYMLFEEVIEHNTKVRKEPLPFSRFAIGCCVVVGLLVALMLYGPKTGLAALA